MRSHYEISSYYTWMLRQVSIATLKVPIKIVYTNAHVDLHIHTHTHKTYVPHLGGSLMRIIRVNIRTH